jgi:hypothetical protein
MHRSYFVLSKGKKSILLILMFVQSQKNPWLAGLNFIDFGVEEYFYYTK